MKRLGEPRRMATASTTAGVKKSGVAEFRSFDAFRVRNMIAFSLTPLLHLATAKPPVFRLTYDPRSHSPDGIGKRHQIK